MPHRAARYGIIINMAELMLTLARRGDLAQQRAVLGWIPITLYEIAATQTLIGLELLALTAYPQIPIRLS
jgi:hypothetical protein